MEQQLLVSPPESEKTSWQIKISAFCWKLKRSRICSDFSKYVSANKRLDFGLLERKIKKEWFLIWFCSVALNISFCLKKQKLRKNESEVFRVKIPQHKVTKYIIYKNSLFSTLVFLQFSRKFYYSGCLISFHKSIKKQGDCPEVYNFHLNKNLQKEKISYRIVFHLLRKENFYKFDFVPLR